MPTSTLLVLGKLPEKDADPNVSSHGLWRYFIHVQVVFTSCLKCICVEDCSEEDKLVEQQSNASLAQDAAFHATAGVIRALQRQHLRSTPWRVQNKIKSSNATLRSHRKLPRASLRRLLHKNPQTHRFPLHVGLHT